jgi:hypothetical protein
MGNVLSMLEATDPRRAGGKAAALARLAEAGFDVPPFVVVPPEAEASGVDALRGELEAALRSIGTDATLYAVRSSGVDEDGADHSFAGQFESYLHIAPADVPECVVKVWASGRSERVAAYRQEHGIGSAPVAPAVLIQRQIRADVAGVAFSADPVSGRRSVAVVSSVWGLGTQLVGGEADADTFRVDRDGAIIEHKIAHKTLAHRPDPTPVSPEDADRPSLTDDQIRAVADLARRAAMHFGRPQDIEWAIENGRLYLLQSRPITTLATLADPDGVLRLWDNSNIAESYGGITTPLTFSFARHAYAGVYREFCRVMGVPKSIIAANDVMFDHMLGLLRGRVYYNLLNWYRLIAMLPGFSVNRAFMEQMMGTRHALPEDLVQKIADEFRVGKLRDSLRLVRTGLGLIVGHLRLPRTIRDFYRRLAESLRLAGMPAGETSTEAISAALGRMRIDELTEEFRKLEAKLLRRWDAPIVNDFLAMIFFGVLGKLCEKWLGKPGMHNELIREGGEIISAEPAQRISAMAEVAAKDSALVDRLCDAEVRDALRAIEAHAELSKQYHAYMDKFGDRCLEELKLESPTLVDDPAPLLRAIGHAARRRLSGADAAPRESAGRHPAEEAARAALRGKPLRRTVFRWAGDSGPTGSSMSHAISSTWNWARFSASSKARLRRPTSPNSHRCANGSSSDITPSPPRPTGLRRAGP